GAGDDVVLGLPIAAPPRLPPAMPQAVDPDLAERVVKDRGTVAARAGRLGFAPMDAVGRKVNPQAPALFFLVAIRTEHLVALLRVLLLQVDPDGARIARARLDKICSFLDVELRFVPGDAVF